MTKASRFGLVHVQNEYIPLYANATYLSLIHWSFHGPFLKVSHTISTEKKTAEEVSYMLEERVLAYLGPPKIFHSDNGCKFVNNLIHAIFKRWGGDVTLVNGRPRHSQSQGLIERGNRTVEMKIAVMKQLR